MADESIPFPILNTKLYAPPPVSDLVMRKRLIDRLTKSFRLPLTLVSAPAGYGKTTLLSSWLEVCDFRSAWLSLDKEDNNLQQFMFYFLAAIQKLFPGAMAKSCALAGGPVAPPVSAFVNTAVNELTQLEEAFVLILDDYHVIRQNTVHDLIASLLQYPLPDMHLILATRTDPPFPLTKLRAGGMMSEIRMQHLRFTPDEATALLETMLNTELDEATSSRLHQKLEGWPVGLRLAALSLQHRGSIDLQPNRLRTKSHYLMDYFVDEILSLQEEPILQYLLATSLLDRFCAPLCDAVLDQETTYEDELLDGKVFIQHLMMENMFVIPLDQQGVWYRYHHLFQQLLQIRIRERCSPEEIANLHSRASIWLANNGLLDGALNHALYAEDTDAAIELVAQNRIKLANREEWNRLRLWLSKLPGTLIDRDPRLLMGRAWLNEFQGRQLEAWSVLDRIEDLVSGSSTESPETKILLGEVNALRSQYLYHIAEGERASSCAESAVASLPIEAYSARGFAIILLAGSYQMNGDIVRAREVLYSALGDQPLLSSSYHCRLLQGLCFIHWMESDLASLKHAAIRCLEVATEFKQLDSYVFAKYFLGICCYQLNDLDEAEQCLRTVVEDPFVARGMIYAQGAFALALCYTAQNRNEDALKVVEQVLDHSFKTNNQAILRSAKGFEAELALRFNQPDGVLHWLSSFDLESFHPMCDFYYPELTLAKALMTRDETDSLQRAEDLLLQLNEFTSTTHNDCFLISVLILQTKFYSDRGNESAAEEYLRKAVSLARKCNAIRPFLDVGPTIAGLLSLLAKKNIAVQFTGRVLKEFRSEAASLASATASEFQTGTLDASGAGRMIEPLTDRELEILTLLGQRLRNKEIADTLFISTETVKSHVSNIFQKLNVNKRHEAVERAHALGIIGS